MRGCARCWSTRADRRSDWRRSCRSPAPADWGSVVAVVAVPVLERLIDAVRVAAVARGCSLAYLSRIGRRGWWLEASAADRGGGLAGGEADPGGELERAEVEQRLVVDAGEVAGKQAGVLVVVLAKCDQRRRVGERGVPDRGGELHH